MKMSNATVFRTAIFVLLLLVPVGAKTRAESGNADQVLRLLSATTVRVSTFPSALSATGIIMKGIPDPATLTLITNRHVIAGADSLAVLFQLVDSDYTPVDILVSVAPLYKDTAKHDSLFCVPDDDLDLVALRIPQPRDSSLGGRLASDAPNRHFWFIDRNIFLDQSHITPGLPVVFAGYPMGLAMKSNRPLLRQGMVAAVGDSDNPIILLDAQVFEGSSGSPVFPNPGVAFGLETLHRNPGKIFIGIIAGYLPFAAADTVEVSGKSTPIESKENSGIAVVLPANEIAKLLRKFEGKLVH